MRRIANNGFTLLEVLIALLILSLGLMGLAGLLVVSVQTNHSAYLRTQASFLAQSIADRMRANVLGVWNGSYAGTYTSATGGAAGGCLNGVSCSYAQVAARDLLIWSNQLASFLPNPTGTIACAPPAAPAPTADQLVERPPYSNTCTVTLAWGEMSTELGGTATTETLDWVFQP
jgi:type IV pilus assembly protein PilV